MLSFSKTRFLSLMPTIEKISQMYEQFKEFFENPIVEFWFWIVNNKSSLFHEMFLKVEGSKICATEASLEYLKLFNSLTHWTEK